MAERVKKRLVTWTPNEKGNPAFGVDFKFPSKYGEPMTKKLNLHLPNDVFEWLICLVENSPGLTLQDVIRRELQERKKEHDKST